MFGIHDITSDFILFHFIVTFLVHSVKVIKYIIKSIMKNNKTPATTTKKKTATLRSHRKAAMETSQLKQSDDGSYLFSNTNLSSDAFDMLSTSINPLTTDSCNSTGFSSKT